MTHVRVHLHDLLAQAAESFPHRPALTAKEHTVSYAELWSLVRTVAGHFAELGVMRGDRIAIFLEKRVEAVAAVFAASLAGAVFVSVNHVLKASQVAHILGDSGATVLVTSDERLGTLAAHLTETAVARVVVVGTERPTERAIEVHPWCTEGGSGLPTLSNIDIDPAAILYTSGSTGRPKGVVLSHRNLIVGAESVSSYLENTSDDVILSVLPLSFDAGFSQVTTAFAVGAHCVLMNYLLPREVPKLCAQYGVTGITGVPPLWMQIADVPWPADAARRLRYWANTGGRMPRVLLDRLRQTFPTAAPYLMYGLTEAFRSTYLDPDEIDRRPDSIGKAIPNAEILVLRPDGTRCVPGEEGELVHRGALVALGYWNDPERTAERYRPVHHVGQSWRSPELAVWSGDTVIADDEGFLYFVGRSDEMIKTSGYRVSPTEIEEAAYSTGLVRDAVALGIEEPGIGHRVVLVATASVGTLDGAAVISALRRILPLYMVPAQIVAKDEMPRSANGKFDRALLKSEVSA